MASFNWPASGSGSGVNVYPNLAAFPAGAFIGDAAIDASNIGNLYEWNGASWVLTASSGNIVLGNLTDVGTDGIVITGGTNAVVGSGTSLAQHVSDASHNGYLSSTDWTTFNSKQSSLTLTNLSDVGTDGITITNGTGSVIGGSPVTIVQHVSDATHNGYLSSVDWTTFNGKQTSGNYITALTGDGLASGPGSVALTLATVNSNVGTFASVTLNGKGLATAAAALSGDLTTSGAVATLATVNSNVGSFTNASITVNGKGLVTAASSGTSTVTSISVATANGLAGSSSGGATPALTLSTTVNSAVLAGNGTAISAATTTGTGSTVVLNNGPTLIAPILGTPASGVATNLTGTASGLTAGNVTTNANLTGDVTSVGNATTLTNAPVIAKVLTGYTSGAGTVSATDSILQAIQKLNGNDSTNANLTGPVTSVGNATSVTNLAITNAMIANTTIDLTTKVTGILPIANGGTAVSSVTIAPAATAFAGWDANKNLSANNFIEGFRTQATANSTLTLVVGDAFRQYFTGTTAGQIVQLPTTSIVAGMAYSIVNASTQTITVNSSGGNLVATMLAGASADFLPNVATPTTTANWTVITFIGGASIAPTIQKFTSGSGTYTTPTNPSPVYIRVRMCGGGGSGGGATNAGTNNASASTFGTSLLNAGAGSPGGTGATGQGGAGGTASLGSGPIGTALTGGAGTCNGVSTTGTTSSGGMGGTNPFGGAGFGNIAGIAGGGANNGGSAASNTGGGGGGGGGNAGNAGGGGGGAGGFIDSLVSSPASTYSYTIGSGGTGGGSNQGGAGGSGYIEVTEYYPVVGTVAGAVAGITPTIQKFTSSSGNYTTPAGVQYISVKMVGAGGGGGGSGNTGTQGAGGTGGNTTFGTSLLVANGGVGGANGNVVSAGGTASLGTGPIGVALQGGSTFGCNLSASITTVSLSGGGGAASPFGGSGGSAENVAGTAAVSNTGSGGGGAGMVGQAAVNELSGNGGAAGGYVNAIIVPTAGQVFAYAVGASGTAGTAGTNGFVGGAGGSGLIEVTEYYSALAVGTTAAVSANLVMAGPTSGGGAAPTFRALVGADLPQPIVARYKATANRAIDGSTRCNYDTQIIDTNSAVTTGASWVFTAPRTAYYLVSTSGAYNTGSGILRLIKNGSAEADFFLLNSTITMNSGSTIVSLAASDIIYIQTSAGSLTLDGSGGGIDTQICISSIN